MVNVSNPRQAGREALQASVHPEVWKRNAAHTDELKQLIRTHRLANHQLISFLNEKTITVEVARWMHLECLHAFTQHFTDSVIQAMVTAAQLEPRLGTRAKIAARFLLMMNVIDELGFQPVAENEKGTGEYKGNPALAHAIEYSKTLDSLGTTPELLAAYTPSKAAIAARHVFTDSYTDHAELTCVLAVGETVFANIASPWAENTGRSTDIDVSKGYHTIHVEDEGGHSIDHDHSEDSWCLFRQAIVPERYSEFKEKLVKWCDTWAALADHLVVTGQEMLRNTK